MNVIQNWNSNVKLSLDVASYNIIESSKGVNDKKIITTS